MFSVLFCFCFFCLSAAPFNCKENFSIPINENNTVETTDFTGKSWEGFTLANKHFPQVTFFNPSDPRFFQTNFKLFSQFKILSKNY